MDSAVRNVQITLLCRIQNCTVVSSIYHLIVYSINKTNNNYGVCKANRSTILILRAAGIGIPGCIDEINDTYQ
jgi:hypothetical protein